MKELIQCIIDNYQGDDLAEHLTNELKAIEDIKFHIQRIQSAKRSECERHEKEIKSLDIMLENIRKSCKHWSATYYADPAGDSSESYHKCNQCGKEW